MRGLPVRARDDVEELIQVGRRQRVPAELGRPVAERVQDLPRKLPDVVLDVVAPGVHHGGRAASESRKASP